MVHSTRSSRKPVLPRMLSLVLLGDFETGKTCLAGRFKYYAYLEEYDRTIEDCHHKQLNVDGEALFVEVVEMDGEWGLLDEASVRAPGGWLLLYSITDRSSFESAQIWAKRLLSIYGEEYAPLVILGTKCDLEYERQVLESEGQAFAAKLGTIYIETSAKLDVNVDAAFVRLIKLIKQHENSLITTKRHRLQRLVHDSGCIII